MDPTPNSYQEALAREKEEFFRHIASPDSQLASRTNQVTGETVQFRSAGDRIQMLNHLEKKAASESIQGSPSRFLSIVPGEL